MTDRQTDRNSIIDAPSGPMAPDWYKQRYFMARDLLWDIFLTGYGRTPESRTVFSILKILKFPGPNGEDIRNF